MNFLHEKLQNKPKIDSTTPSVCQLVGPSVCNTLLQGCILLSRFWFFFPCLWFSSLRRVALHYKIYDFPPHKAKKQYIIGLNSVKMCCSDQILPFGTIKSIKSSKNFLFSSFLAFDFFPHLQTLWFYSPPRRGGGNAQLYTGLHQCSINY